MDGNGSEKPAWQLRSIGTQHTVYQLHLLQPYPIHEMLQTWRKKGSQADVMLRENSLHQEKLFVPFQSTRNIKKTLGRRIQHKTVKFVFVFLFFLLVLQTQTEKKRSPKPNAGSNSAGCKAINNRLIPGEICSIKSH